MSNQNIVVRSNYGFMQPNTLQDAMACAKLIQESSLCPTNKNGVKSSISDIVIQLQLGLELDLQPMQSVQDILVVNGRASVWGYMMIAICKRSPLFEYMTDGYFEKGDEHIVIKSEKYSPSAREEILNQLRKTTNFCVCIAKRRNQPECIKFYSENDAKLAKLWNKQGSWSTDPKVMLQWRATTRGLKGAFPDLLKGITSREEAEDIIDYSKTGVTIDSKDYIYNSTIIDEDHISILKMKIEESESEQDSILDYLKIDKLEDMTIQCFQKVVRVMDKKIAEKKKKELEDEVVKQYFESDDESQVEDGSENSQGSIL